MTNGTSGQGYERHSGLNGTALLLQAVGLLVGLMVGFVSYRRAGQTVPAWYTAAAGVGALVGAALLAAAIGVYRRRPRAVHLAGGWYMVLAAVAAIYAIAALLVVEDLTLRLLLSLAGAMVAVLAFVLAYAVTKQIEPDNAHGARLLGYGVRVETAVLLLVAVVAMVNYAAREKYVRWDWTTGGSQRLSPRSLQLVKGVNKPVRLTSLYAILEDVPESAELKEHLERVKRLFDEYQRANPMIEVATINPIKDKDKVAELLARLKKVYQPEAKDHIDLIQQFVQTDLEELRKGLEAEQSQAEQLEPAGKDRVLADLLNQAVSAFGAMSKQADRTGRALRSVLDSEIPRYTEGTNAIRSYCQDVKNLLESATKAYGEAVVQIKDLDEPAKQFFQGGRERLGGLLSRCQELTDRVNGLKSLQSETLQFDLQQQNPIILETDDGAKVLSFYEIWPESPGEGARGSQRRVFAGEEKISSAILALTQKQKAAVLFVHWGGGPAVGFRGQFSAVAQTLRETNFEVRDWDVQQEPEPPTVENMSRAIWVIIPPQPPPPTPEMPFNRPPNITTQQKEMVEHFLNSGGRALFLMTPADALLGPPSPFIEKLKEYGIRVNPDAVAIWGVPMPDGPVRAVQYVVINQYPTTGGAYHPIAKDLGPYQSVFFRAVPVEPIEAKGAEASVLVRVPAGADYWGEKAYMAGSFGGSWKKDADDLPGGFPIAMASQKGNSKVVVVGDLNWASDQVATVRAGFLGLGGLRFPGNVLLFENAIFWLNDNEQMIAVPQEMLRVARIGPMSEVSKWSWRLVAIAGLPLACLIAGGVVYLFRRT